MVAGYVVAVATASATMVITALLWDIVTGSIPDPTDQSLLEVLARLIGYLIGTYFITLFFAFFIALFSLLPATVLILTGELLGVRWRLYYAMAGSIAGLASEQFYISTLPMWHAPDPVMFTFSGGVGGMVYWAFAGRGAQRVIHCFGKS